MKFIKILLFFSLISFGFSTVYTDLQKEEIGDEVLMKMLEEIFREAMKVKRDFQSNQLREELIENLASTAPREEFVVNADLSNELAESNPSAIIYVSTDGQNSWTNSEDIGPINEVGFESTWGTTVNTSGEDAINWFLSGEVNSEALGYDYGNIIVSQSPNNIADAWPTGDNLFALLANDEEGETSSGQDIVGMYGSFRGFGEEIAELYIKLSLDGNCCSDGSTFGPWYLYGVGIVNPDSDPNSEDAVAYAIGYGNGGFGQLTPGLLKLSGDLATGELGGFEYITTNIDYNTSGNDLSASVLFDYIINDNDFGEWPNSMNGVITLGVTVEASLSGFDVAAEILDQTNFGLFLLSSQYQDGNAEPVISDAQFDGDSWTMSVNYSDEDGNLPWFRSGQVCYPAGACFLYLDLVPDAHTYADGVGYSASFAGEDIADGDYELHFWFEDDDEIDAAQVVLPVTLGAGGGCGETGDVNGDGAVNVVDVVLAVNYILAQSFDGCADLNGDGALNVVDIVILVNIILE